MSVARIQVLFDRTTGNPADTQSNTWYFDGDTATYTTGATVAEAAMPLLEAFYGVVNDYMSSNLFQGPARVQAYDMADPEPRIPVFEDTIAMTYGVTGWIPLECTMCMSFQAERISGEPQSRRRGRLYLPTFNAAATAVTGGRVHWTSSTVSAIATAAGAVVDNSISGLNWAVFSPTIYATSGSLDLATNDVVDGWIDDEPDTQRRRGGMGGTRTTFSA